MVKKLQQGFTLIELLIVMGIIGILAGVVLVGIDPIDKLNAANDTKAQRDIYALANASESYAATHSGCYNLYSAGACTATLLAQGDLVTSGDLKVALTPPAGYAYVTTGAGAADGHWSADLKSKKYTSASTPFWVWCASKGKAGPTAAAGTCP